MITQYNATSSISTDIQNLVANSIGLCERYILMQTDEYTYTALIYNSVLKRCRKIEIKRTGQYNSLYTVSRSEDSEFKYTVTNEYYTYSNLGIGKSLSLPINDSVTSYSCCAIVCFLCIILVFKEVFFSWSRRRS